MGRREGECDNSWLSKVFDKRYVTFRLCGVGSEAKRATRSDELDVDIEVIILFTRPGVSDFVAIGRKSGIKFLTVRTGKGHDLEILLSSPGIPGRIKPGRAPTNDNQDHYCQAGPQRPAGFLPCYRRCLCNLHCSSN